MSANNAYPLSAVRVCVCVCVCVDVSGGSKRLRVCVESWESSRCVSTHNGSLFQYAPVCVCLCLFYDRMSGMVCVLGALVCWSSPLLLRLSLPLLSGSGWCRFFLSPNDQFGKRKGKGQRRGARIQFIGESDRHTIASKEKESTHYTTVQYNTSILYQAIPLEPLPSAIQLLNCN